MSSALKEQSLILLSILGYMLLLASGSDNLLPWFFAFLFLMIVLIVSFDFNSISRTPIFFASFIFSLLIIAQLIINARLISTVDMFPGWYMAIMPLLGVFIDKKTLEMLFKYIVLIFSLLAVWGLFQHYTGLAVIEDMDGRANSFFTTPNSFAAALNLVLLLLISLYANNKNSGGVLFVILLMFAALLVTESRGAWTAFFISLVIMTFLYIYYGLLVNKKRIFQLSIGMLTIFACYTLINVTDNSAGSESIETNNAYNIQQATKNFPLTSRGDSIHARLSIYSDSLELVRENPFLGHGFMTFGDHYPRVKSNNYEKTYIFTHNDYLQFLVEMGFVGLIILCLYVLAFYWVVCNCFSHLDEKSFPVVIGITAAVTSFFGHALVDFVFYIPAIFLLAACYIGYMHQLYRDQINRYLAASHFKFTNKFQNVVKIILFLPPITVLAKPALADTIFVSAENLYNQGEISLALDRFELSRQLAPQQPFYYQIEALHWLRRADDYSDRQRVEKALDLYKRSAQNNPFDIQSRYQLAYLNTLYRGIIKKPASIDQVTRWLDNVVASRPWDSDLRQRSQHLKAALMSFGD